VRLILHGGMPKTGTTALRHYLSRNADRLAPHGVLYPRAGRQVKRGRGGGNRVAQHHAFFLSLIPDRALVQAKPYRPQHDAATYASMLRREIAAARPRVVLLSSEYLFYPEFDAAVLERVPALLGVERMELFLVLRRREDWAPSLYAQRVKGASRFTGSFARHVEELEARGILDYARRLRTLEAAVGRANLDVHRYERIRGDVLAPLLRLADVPRDVPATAAPGTNRRLSWTGVAALRRLNGLGTPAAPLRKLVAALDARVASPALRDRLDRPFTREIAPIRDALRQRYAAEDAALGERYPRLGPPP
jgi:hypothetical protein